MFTHPLEGIFNPQSIAIVGASNASFGMGAFVASLVKHGFKGNIYPVNPKYSEIHGIRSYPCVKDIPGPFDYLISSVPASEVLTMLEDCSNKGVKFAHIFTARFSETGRREAIELEQLLLRKAKHMGIRLIGPNCMGVYNPKGGISWEPGFPRESGPVGFASQSGVLVLELIRIGVLRGLRFSKVISYGNAIDINESDFLDYFAHDPETKIILMYIEGVKDGKRFFKTLRHAASLKPVIILKGGKGKAGVRAAISHTAAIAGSMPIWHTVIAQTGAISAANPDEMIDLAVAFDFLPPITGNRVGVSVGAGGTSVLGADICETAGLDVIPLPDAIREELKAKGVAVWDWISNPVDFSISIGDANFSSLDILRMMAKDQNFDLIITSDVIPWRRSNQGPLSMDTYIEPYKNISDKLKPLLALVPDYIPSVTNLTDDRWKTACEVAAKLIAAKVPVYPTIDRAANAAGKLINYYRAINDSKFNILS